MDAMNEYPVVAAKPLSQLDPQPPVGFGMLAVFMGSDLFMGSDSINRYYAAPCLFGLPFGNGTALRSVKRSIFD